MDERIEELYKAVLREEGKPLGEMRQEVRRHIVEAEKIVKETTEPHLETPHTERAVQRFRHTFRAHLVRVTRRRCMRRRSA
jgi:acyl-CoA reductase-like NAD-dependent aldehyde dehydrogenase